MVKNGKKTEKNGGKAGALPGMEGAQVTSVEIEDVAATARQVAALYGVSTQSVHKWRERGAPHQRDGKQFVFPLPELVQWRRKRDREEAAGALGDEEKGDTRWDVEGKMWRAKSYKLEYEREVGILVLRETVRKQLIRCVSALRQELEALGKRHGSAVQNDVAEAVDRFLKRGEIDAYVEE